MIKSFMQNSMYMMKQTLGDSVDIYRFTKQVIDTKTGQITQDKLKIHLDKVLIFGEEDLRKFTYSRAFIAENRQFTVGGFYDVESRICLIDPLDLPDGYLPQMDDYLVSSDQKRYQMTKIGLGDSIIVKLKETKGLELQQILDAESCSEIELRTGLSNG